ncbi:MAG: KdsC family phosphatase [Bacteroidota bacterium]
MSNVPSTSFQSIRHFIFDVDGVLTDSTVWVMPAGEQVRRMNIKDGYALQLALKKGYTITILSGSTPSSVQDRLQKLGITDIHFSVSDKAGFMKAHSQEKGWDLSQILFMGDDLPDLDAMSLVGLATCPKDAVSEILEQVAYVSPLTGGLGCVRDVIEQVLRHQGQWQHLSNISSR